MIHFLFSDLRWKLFSLAIAISVWYLVASEPEMETVLSVPVQYENTPMSLEPVSDFPETVKLELRGTSTRLRELSLSKTAVILNFGSVREQGERSFAVTEASAHLPRGVQLVRAVPSELHFRFERLAVKKVPVRVRFSGKLPAGLAVASAAAVPETVMVAGPESRVQRVEYANTDPIDLNTVNHDVTRPSSVYLTEPEVRFTGNPQVRVKVAVRNP